jgi:hypothetical protein
MGLLFIGPYAMGILMNQAKHPSRKAPTHAEVVKQAIERSQSMLRAAREQKKIDRHLAAIGPTNYQVDDVVVCKVSGQGLEAGQVYPVYSVLRRRTRRGVETVVTVSADLLGLVEIGPAEPVLRRTQLEVRTTLADGHEQCLLFTDASEFEAWRERNQVAADQVSELRYVEML